MWPHTNPRVPPKIFGMRVEPRCDRQHWSQSPSKNFCHGCFEDERLETEWRSVLDKIIIVDHNFSSLRTSIFNFVHILFWTPILMIVCDGIYITHLKSWDCINFNKLKFMRQLQFSILFILGFSGFFFFWCLGCSAFHLVLSSTCPPSLPLRWLILQFTYLQSLVHLLNSQYNNLYSYFHH